MMQIRMPRTAVRAMVPLTAAALLAVLFVVLIGAKPAGATFPGANGKIAFVKGSTGSHEYGDIYTMNANGSGVSKLTSGLTSTAPSFSAAGTKIAFTKLVNGSTELYTMSPSGSSQTRLTNNSDTDHAPSFSPDGRKIAFHSNRAGNGVNESPDPDNEIWAMKAAPESATNRPVRLTRNAASDGDPNWSPDGTKIVFVSRRVAVDNPEVYIMNADGTGQKRLTKSAGGDFTPEFSPDGKKIAFWSDRDGDQEIYTMNINGTGTKKLTNNTILDYTPTFSPDGKKIAFSRSGGTSVRDQQIYTMNVDGSGTKKLTTDILGDLYPTWQPLR